MRARTIKMFTFGRTIDGVVLLRVRRNPEFGEFTVEHQGENGRIKHSRTYFTTDKDDALDTAQFEFNRYLEGHYTGVKTMPATEGKIGESVSLAEKQPPPFAGREVGQRIAKGVEPPFGRDSFAKCKRHKWEVNYKNTMGLFLTPTGHKDQHVAVKCSKCGKTGWENTRTGRMLNR